MNTIQHTVMFQGRVVPIAELARQRGLDRRTLQSRLARGLPVEEALEKPLRAYPDGVRRSAGPPKVEGPTCDHCGGQRYLATFGGGNWTLCSGCRSRVTEIIMDWISTGPLN